MYSVVYKYLNNTLIKSTNMMISFYVKDYYLI